jgi:arylsulfatase A-like enzyme
MTDARRGGEGSRAPAAPSPGAGAGAGELLGWPLAGVLAGVGVGLADSGWAILRGIGGLGPARAGWLLALAGGTLGLAGLVAGAAIAVGAWLVRRAGPEGGRGPAARLWLGPALVAAACAPIFAIDAFAMFRGRKAAEIPGHRAIAVGLALVGTAAVLWAARWAARAGSGSGARSTRARRLVLGVGGLLSAAVAELANQLVLRRLYPWFHATLALATGVAALLGVHALMDRAAAAGRAGTAADARRRWRALATGLAALAVSGVAALAVARARSRQTLRFAVTERTAATAELVRALPSRIWRGPPAARAGAADDLEARLPPLPEGPRRPDADVLIITVDALRADHVGAYGYTRHPTTPHIDKLAAQGVRFARAYAQAPHTSFSVATMLTGKYFPTLARLAPAEVHDPIASVLRQYNWRTAVFYPPAVFFVDAQKLKPYADSHFSFEYVKFEYLPAPKRVDQIIRYFELEKPEKSFVWVHFFEPHEPYDAHPEFPFGGADLDRYDSEIAYADASIGRLVAYVRDRRPGTIIILAADHGEEFDEHGGRYHGSSLFEEQVHIPLVVSVPGVKPRVIDAPVELIDVTPTLLNLLDIPVPARMRGTDLGPWLADPPAPEGRLPPAFAEVEDKRMIALGHEKLICDLGWGFCAYHDLSSDPGERRNLADERPERAAALRARLDDWLDSHVRLEPVLARGAANPNGERVPRAIERGRLGDLLAGPALAELMLSKDEPLPVRREAAQLLVTLPARAETAQAIMTAARDPDATVAAWAAVGAVRLGDRAAIERVERTLDDPQLPMALRLRGALSLAARGDAAGVPVLGQALGSCSDQVLTCRLIVLQLGKLRDRRAVPVLLEHLGEVQNRREMVDALGDIGDPRAIAALIDRLRHDEYVPVRAQAARALAKIWLATKPPTKPGGAKLGDPPVASRARRASIGADDADDTIVQALAHASASETEALVIAAARESLARIQAAKPD